MSPDYGNLAGAFGQGLALQRQQAGLSNAYNLYGNSAGWTISGGTSTDTITVTGTPYITTGGYDPYHEEKKRTNVDWLRGRVDEMRVPLS